MNVFGAPVVVFPTLVSSAASYAFRCGADGVPRQGVVLCEDRAAGVQWLDEPWACERERAMGFPAGYTVYEGWPERERCRLLGQSVDQHQMRCLWRAVAASPTESAAEGGPVGVPEVAVRRSALLPAARIREALLVVGGAIPRGRGGGSGPLPATSGAGRWGGGGVAESMRR